MSAQERTEFNLEAERMIDSLGIDIDVTGREFDVLRESGLVGYANYYLKNCWNESELKNIADVIIYKQLLEIDAKLGTTQTEQLFVCVFHSLRMDLFMV